MDAPIAAERRASPRRRTLLAGVARQTDRLAAATMDCRIRNLSDHGARLEVARAGWLPDRFELAVNGRELRKWVEVVWRGPDAAGVRFTAGEDGSARDEVTRLRNENRKLGVRLRELTG